MAGMDPVVEVKIKKDNVFSRIKKWWKYTLTEEDRTIFKVAGLWCVDGLLLGSVITAGVGEIKKQKAVIKAEAEGYLNGKMDAYREMAQKPMDYHNKSKRF